ncbi:hypothetical protein K3G63_04765 [Hymenobacter sp. HSC-4F20]|uniref:hypothetical protein n=1 Tax=Hymenobacter sp. HSC-4F20 TaxID=2864135 RepID=UPI001C73A3B7|nr:hypothetical protein [Hymenobacter sp. HSC-4F20]MBX0289736.1 hypothetical protein [Hymenobacter sp. HSC-4F20]
MGRPKKKNSEKLLHRFDFMRTEKMVRNHERMAKAKGISLSKVLQDYLEDGGGVSQTAFKTMDELTKLNDFLENLTLDKKDLEAIRFEIKRIIFSLVKQYVD